MEGKRSTADVRGVTTGQFTENVSFFDDATDFESGNWTSTLSKNAVRVCGKQKAIGGEVELGSVLHSKIFAFQIGDGSDEGSVVMRSENGRVNVGKSCLSSDCPEKTLTNFGLSELEVMARTRAGELGLVPM